MYTTEALNKELEEIKKLISKKYEVTFQEDLESGRLEKVMESIRFNKGRNINKKELSEHYGCNDKTILDLLVQYAFHLLCNDDAKYLSDSFDDISWEYSRNEEGHIDNKRL